MKKGGLFLWLLLLIVSCSDDDLNSVNVVIIDKEAFITDEITRFIEVSNEEVLRVASTANGQYLFGVFNDSEFGTLQGSFVSQIALPSNVYLYDFEKEPDSIITSALDDVVLYIPYQATVKDISSEGDYTYTLDSIFGVKDIEADPIVYGDFDFEVRELEKFLNTLDPQDPSTAKMYYTDEDYNLPSEGALLASGTYAFSANDQVTYISREIDGAPYQDDDEISLPNQAPRIAIHLDKTFFTTEFLEKFLIPGETPPTDDFSSYEDFIRYFKGLYVKATSTEPAAIASLLLSDAYLEIYYTNKIELVSNGETVDVEAKTKRFSFGGVKASQYLYPERTVKTGDKLYIQGAAGSIGNIKLFGYDEANPEIVTDDLLDLREQSNNQNNVPIWLINEASIRFYVDESLTSVTDKVHKLFLYKKVPEIDGYPAYNSQLLDYLASSTAVVSEGNLTSDSDGVYYNFRITDYVTELLDGRNTKNVDNLGLKLFNSSDFVTSATDTIVNSMNWDPRGVVLYSGTNATPIENRAVLKINYSVQDKNNLEEE